MFKLVIFLSLIALAFAKPGYLHSAPVLTSYHRHVAVPAVHIVRPVIASHHVVAAAPLIHHQPSVLHGSYHGGYHGGYHHGLF